MNRCLILLISILQFTNLFGQACSPDALIHRTIKAVATDSNIDWELQNHQIYINPDCIQKEKLVIHLVGSFDNPANTSYFPTLAANNGFKAINLKYPNNIAAVSTCADSEDAGCFEAYREEIIFGIDSHSELEVDENNCIINRIEKLLSHLDANFPAENWGDFLSTSGDINWSNIIVSGHSQGGGHAAFLAKGFELNRALMFAAPNDYSDFFSAPANWVSAPGMTANSNYFAFGNLFDNVVDFDKQFQIWEDMNLLMETDSTDVDNAFCNYNNSNVLYTLSSFSSNHSNMIIDAATPLAAGIPVFTPVWEYMLGICEIMSPISDIEEENTSLNVFPNPSSSTVFVENDKIISRLEIYDFSGALLEVLEPQERHFQLNLSKYSGLLIFKISIQDTKEEVYKLVNIEKI